MKKISLLFLLLSSTLLFTQLNAEDDAYIPPRLGTVSDGGLYLYREPIEMYWNDWVAYPLLDRKTLPSHDQVEALIKADGKTTGFYGVLSINCNNGKYYWEGTPSNFQDPLDETKIKSVVPQQVVDNAISLFCKK
jgi:hypothetical protein